MKGSLLFLGTGGSVGVPMVGCQCAVCKSDSPFNRRLRSSALIQLDHRQYLIDAGPDFREQALRHGISKLDGVLLTHAHHDHTAGFDDLRPIFYRMETPLSILLSNETAAEVQTRFSYMFDQNELGRRNPLKLQLLPGQAGDLEFEGLPLHYLSFEQAGMKVNGYRVGNLAYLSDIRHYNTSIFDRLKGLKHLIVSALRYTPSSHFSVDEAIDFAAQVKAEKTWLTHLSHELDYLSTNAYLPPHIRLAYDGLSLEFEL